MTDAFGGPGLFVYAIHVRRDGDELVLEVDVPGRDGNVQRLELARESADTAGFGVEELWLSRP